MSQRYSGKSRKDSSTMKKSKLSLLEKRKIKREKKKKRQIYKMEEEDKKAERDLEILKNYQKKEGKSIKKIFITLFLLAALFYIVNFLWGFFK